MTYENVLCEVADRVARVTVNRPEKLNALNRQTLTELGQIFDALAADDSVSVVVVTGAGEKAFVAGADIGELLEVAGQAERAKELASFGQTVFDKLDALGKPSVAMVNGFALGGGCELALACTLRTASLAARMGLPEVGLGVIPGYGGTQRLARIAGPGVAREWVLTADMYPAEEAHRVGVVNRVFPPEELEAGTLKMVQGMLAKGPEALRYGMQAILDGWDLSLGKGQALETDYFGKASLTEDMREGMAAFLEKRKAQFKGR